MSSLKGIKQLRRLHVTSGKGFSLVVAILAILILAALGYLVVMMSTQDTRVSARVVGEKKAMAAAETGIHQFMASFDPMSVTVWPLTGTTSDATSTYSIAQPVRPPVGSGMPPEVPRAGFALGAGGVDQMWMADVTGISTKYNATVNVQVGIGSFSWGAAGTEYEIGR